MRHQREEADFSYSEMGRRLGVARQVYTRWETAENQAPYDVLEKWASIFGMDLIVVLVPTDAPTQAVEVTSLVSELEEDELQTAIAILSEMIVNPRIGGLLKAVVDHEARQRGDHTFSQMKRIQEDHFMRTELKKRQKQREKLQAQLQAVLDEQKDAILQVESDKRALREMAERQGVAPEALQLMLDNVTQKAADRDDLYKHRARDLEGEISALEYEMSQIQANSNSKPS